MMANWESLANISPASAVLRTLDKQFINSLGSPSRGSSHTAPDDTQTIMFILCKLRECKAQIINPNTKAVKVTQDILSRGECLLREGTLSRFLAKRRTMLFGAAPPPDEDDDDEIPPANFHNTTDE